MMLLWLDKVMIEKDELKDSIPSSSSTYRIQEFQNTLKHNNLSESHYSYRAPFLYVLGDLKVQTLFSPSFGSDIPCHAILLWGAWCIPCDSESLSDSAVIYFLIIRFCPNSDSLQPGALLCLIA